MEHVEMRQPDGTGSSGAEDGLLRKTKTGEEKGRGREQRARGKRRKRGCMLELESKLGGRKLKQGSRLSGLAITFFPVYFIFFISLMFHSL